MSETQDISIPLVLAVITQWNGYEDTAACIESVQASSYPNLKAIVVDNGSTDNSPQRLAERFPEVPQLYTGHNGSVTKAYNIGLQYALDNNAEFILLLNNDTVLDPSMVSLMVEAAISDPIIGQVIPKTYFYEPADVIWFAGGKRSRFDFGAYHTFEGHKDEPANSFAKEVDYAWASGVLIRRSLLEDMGLFDTRFFLYYDDVDMSIRTQQAGYRIWYVPEAKMWHKVSHSTGSARFTRIWAQSKMRLYRKHAKGIHQWVLIIFAFAHGLFRALIPNEKNLRMSAHSQAYFSGLIDGLRAWEEDRENGS